MIAASLRLTSSVVTHLSFEAKTECQLSLYHRCTMGRKLLSGGGRTQELLIIREDTLLMILKEALGCV